MTEQPKGNVSMKPGMLRPPLQGPLSRLSLGVCRGDTPGHRADAAQALGSGRGTECVFCWVPIQARAHSGARRARSGESLFREPGRLSRWLFCGVQAGMFPSSLVRCDLGQVGSLN